MTILLTLESGFQSGAYNMALDEAFLEWVRISDKRIWVVRTYQWSEPTLSLGHNQPDKDIAILKTQFKKTDRKQDQKPERWVKRPTGGRAILHGQDIAFSFITNDKHLCQKSLQDSYKTLSNWVASALKAIGISVLESPEPDERAYTRSAVCFETHTQSDLLNIQGEKIAGSAQCRRAGGILQHGSAFIPVEKQPFLSDALFAEAQNRLSLMETETLQFITLPTDFPLEQTANLGMIQNDLKSQFSVLYEQHQRFQIDETKSKPDPAL